MTIDINGLPPSQPQGTGHGAAVNSPQDQNGGANPAAGGPGKPGDKVSLTDTAKQLQGLADHVAQLPAVDSQRVDAIRQAVTNGTYQVHPQRVADKMVAFEKALGGH